MTTQPEPEDTIDRGVSEFGDLLGDLIASTPHALGAVLSDGVDDTIDTAYRPGLVSAMDIQITGAQFGQVMCRLDVDLIIFGLGRGQILIEAEQSMLICEVLSEQYLLTLQLDRRANLARALREFESVGAQLLALLR